MWYSSVVVKDFNDQLEVPIMIHADSNSKRKRKKKTFASVHRHGSRVRSIVSSRICGVSVGFNEVSTE